MAAHSFYPFLAYEKEERQLKRVHMRDKSHKKKRPIRYAAHTDGYIFSYYAKQLAELYKNKLQALDLQECVLAYLKGNGSNIEFARDAFNEVEKRDACVAITFDISSFFDSLDHALLKRRWCELLGQQTLPDDHYKISGQSLSIPMPNVMRVMLLWVLTKKTFLRAWSKMPENIAKKFAAINWL